MNLNFGRTHRFQPKPSMYCPLGMAINQKLAELNYSGYQFCKEFGISSSYLSHIMRGDSPRSPQIPKIKKALGISDDYIASMEQQAS